MKSKWNILILLMLVCGLGVLFYPVVSNWLAARNHSKIIEEYQLTAGQLSDQEKQEVFARADEYNQKLIHRPVVDPFTSDGYEYNEEYFSNLNLNGVMGFISIPVIDVNLPIYHTSREEVLKKGVGHLEGSSLPVGGAGNHVILTAHRGLPSAKLFTDLDKTAVGDRFYLQVLDQAFCYEIDQITVIEPQETEDLEAVDGEDYVTLVTCTPYAINSHRLLVRGKRAENSEETAENGTPRAVRSRLPWMIGLGSLSLAGGFGYRWIKKRKR